MIQKIKRKRGRFLKYSCFIVKHEICVTKNTVLADAMSINTRTFQEKKIYLSVKMWQFVWFALATCFIVHTSHSRVRMGIYEPTKAERVQNKSFNYWRELNLTQRDIELLLML